MLFHMQVLLINIPLSSKVQKSSFQKKKNSFFSNSLLSTTGTDSYKNIIPKHTHKKTNPNYKNVNAIKQENHNIDNCILFENSALFLWLKQYLSNC